MGITLTRWIVPAGLAVVVSVLVSPAQAQVRGVYPLGMSATNSGVTPEPGFTFSNVFLLYSRDQLKGPDGEVLATGEALSDDEHEQFRVGGREADRDIGRGKVLGVGYAAGSQQFAHFRRSGRPERRRWIWRFLLPTADSRLAEETRRHSGSLWVSGSHRQIRLQLE